MCNAKFEDLGDNGDKGRNVLSKVSYLESQTLTGLFTMQMLWRYNND